MDRNMDRNTDRETAQPFYTAEPVAHIETHLSGKFGLPRQFGIVPALTGTIVFEPAFRNPDALRGLEDFSHIWLLWVFSESVRPGEAPPLTARPPRLGGNVRMGVFATRSPFRPNNLGLSAVRLEKITWDSPRGPLLTVSGVDLMNGTPILDIKPYIPYADSIPDASGGFTAGLPDLSLSLVFPEELLKKIPPENREELCEILQHDMRPQYQNDPERLYGLTYLSFNVRFRIADGVLTVCEVVPCTHESC